MWINQGNTLQIGDLSRYQILFTKFARRALQTDLRNVLPSLINEDQTGFMSKRYMGDNITYDLIHYLNCNYLPGLPICIDLDWAFDTVDWNFMMKVLKAFGLGPDVCH